MCTRYTRYMPQSLSTPGESVHFLHDICRISTCMRRPECICRAEFRAKTKQDHRPSGIYCRVQRNDISLAPLQRRLAIEQVPHQLISHWLYSTASIRLLKLGVWLGRGVQIRGFQSKGAVGNSHSLLLLVTCSWIPRSHLGSWA